jgi:hypothetical protein
MWTPDALRQAALYEETPAPSATDTASLNNPGWKHNPFAEAYDSVTKPGPGAPTNQGEGLPAPTTPFKTAEIPHGNAESGPQENEADNSDEIAKRAWDALPVGEFLFDRTPFLGTVKSYYPGFGELLGVIYSSVTGVIFENARDWVVEQVITKWAVDGEVTATTIPELVAARVSMIHFDFSSFTPSWTQTAAEKISRAREQVKNARTQLLRATLDKEREETAELARDTQEDARLLGTAGMALHSSGLEKTAQSVQNFTTELADLGKSWPPLTGPDTSHFVRLAEISEKIQSADLENSGGSSSWGSKQPQESVVLRKAAQSPIAAGLHLVPEWQSPIAAIRDLDRFCKARTLMIVAEVTSAGAEWKPLMDAMGRSQFHYYYMIVESEVKQPPEVKKAIPKINDWHVKIDGEKDKGNEQPAKEPDPIKPRLEFR